VLKKRKRKKEKRKRKKEKEKRRKEENFEEKKKQEVPHSLEWMGQFILCLFSAV